MEFHFPFLLVRERSMQSTSFNYGNSYGFPIEKLPGVVVELTSSAQWKSYLDASRQNNKLLVIEFTAAWCGPCRFMEPTIKEFAAKYTDVDFIKIDVDRLMSVAQQFSVNTMPSFVLMKRGQQVDKVAGARKDELQHMIEKHGTSWEYYY